MKSFIQVFAKFRNKAGIVLFVSCMSIFSLLISCSSDSYKLKKAAALYESGQYSQALEILKPLADKGLKEAQSNLAQMYYNGEGVKQDYQEAFKWTQKAAEQGVVHSQYNLGLLFNNGQGVKRDYQEAFKWYLKAAGQEYALAQYNLGILYYNGQGIKRSIPDALYWIQKAADQGNGAALHFLKTH